MNVIKNDSIINYCQWCLGIGKSRCGRCHNAYYCSREHQVQHWSIHKKECMKNTRANMIVAPTVPGSVPVNPNSIETLPSYDEWCRSNLRSEQNEGNNLISTVNQKASYYLSSSRESEQIQNISLPQAEDYDSTINLRLEQDNSINLTPTISQTEDQACVTLRSRQSGNIGLTAQAGSYHTADILRSKQRENVCLTPMVTQSVYCGPEPNFLRSEQTENIDLTPITKSGYCASNILSSEGNGNIHLTPMVTHPGYETNIHKSNKTENNSLSPMLNRAGYCASNQSVDSTMMVAQTTGYCASSSLEAHQNIGLTAMVTQTKDYHAQSMENSEQSVDLPLTYDDEIFSSLNSELLSSDNNFWDVINNQNMAFDYDMYLGREKITSETFEEQPLMLPETNSSQSDDEVDMIHCVPLHDICTNVIHDLNTYGICVLDKFIGIKSGELILQEVKNLYLKGMFKKGELVNTNPYLAKENIRRDVTTWVDGTELECKNIGNLIRKLDVVVTTCNKMSNNGLLSKYKLHRRTKAMIACYPGDGTYYKKHIDNPNGDGRCITCIYYLNKNWNVKVHGGLLRMFPVAHDSQVANIEPVFDRMLFFWSDKRNPHEVLPSYATRFAITVWYFDADERDKALMKVRSCKHIK